MSGGGAKAVVELKLLVWFSLFCTDTHPCMKMLLVTITQGEQEGAKLARSPRAGGASHIPTACPQPAVWHPPNKSSRGFRGPQSPLFGEVLE